MTKTIYIKLPYFSEVCRVFKDKNPYTYFNNLIYTFNRENHTFYPQDMSKALQYIFVPMLVDEEFLSDIKDKKMKVTTRIQNDISFTINFNCVSHAMIPKYSTYPVKWVRELWQDGSKDYVKIEKGRDPEAIRKTKINLAIYYNSRNDVFLCIHPDFLKNLSIMFTIRYNSKNNCYMIPEQVSGYSDGCLIRTQLKSNFSSSDYIVKYKSQQKATVGGPMVTRGSFKVRPNDYRIIYARHGASITFKIYRMENIDYENNQVRGTLVYFYQNNFGWNQLKPPKKLTSLLDYLTENEYLFIYPF